MQKLREQVKALHTSLSDLDLQIPQQYKAVHTQSAACLKNIALLMAVYKENQKQWTAVNRLFTGEQSLTQFLVGRIDVKTNTQCKEAQTEFGILDFYTPLEKKDFTMPLDADFLERMQKFCVSNLETEYTMCDRQLQNINVFIGKFEKVQEKLKLLISKAENNMRTLYGEPVFTQKYSDYVKNMIQLNNSVTGTIDDLKSYLEPFKKEKQAIEAQQKLVIPNEKGPRHFWDILEYVKKIQAYDELNFLQMYVAKKAQREGRQSAPDLLAILRSATPASPARPESAPRLTSEHVLPTTCADRLHTLFKNATINYARQAFFLSEICETQRQSLREQMFETVELQQQFQKWRQYFIKLNEALCSMDSAEKQQAVEEKQVIDKIQSVSKIKREALEAIRFNLECFEAQYVDSSESIKAYGDLCCANAENRTKFKQVIEFAYGRFSLITPKRENIRLLVDVLKDVKQKKQDYPDFVKSILHDLTHLFYGWTNNTHDNVVSPLPVQAFSAAQPLVRAVAAPRSIISSRQHVGTPPPGFFNEADYFGGVAQSGHKGVQGLGFGLGQLAGSVQGEAGVIKLAVGAVVCDGAEMTAFSFRPGKGVTMASSVSGKAEMPKGVVIPPTVVTFGFNQCNSMSESPKSVVVRAAPSNSLVGTPVDACPTATPTGV